MINLPSKDKYGNSYLSYSQISLFLRDKDEYYKSYILKEPFLGNEYTEFGNKVGAALENNNFDKFDGAESETLKKVTRLDLFERKTILKYEDFYVIGYIDTIKEDFTELIDYKTGGQKKEFQYSKEGYSQLCYYALSIRQETGITPIKASVEFIRRVGNLYRGQELKVSDEEPIKISIDISEDRLKSIYWDTIKTAKEIESFYLKNN